ncbi:hypothetical protein RJ53_08055 [Methanocalculus chunghsingensis]|uniref:RDD domain-containing protein n=1 Tax=Methanocalculus chunghsingensis TaxID=156457 RepID=A0A8J7W6W4_9EURY|nr:RDD family protein [Methanocalculus chunghsingensis]MBR1369449.1 hypothetical protein [Methanocalculus chunghsingensis]
MGEIHIAGWETRFWAWLIDLILISVSMRLIDQLISSITGWSPASELAFSAGTFWFITSFWSGSVLLFFYWTIMEGTGGQSVGKMVMNLKVTGRRGETAGIPRAAVSAFGKAFILPLDCLIGWLGMPGTGLRLANRISETMVIRSEYPEPEGVTYIRKDD